jgi:hypothetical protein
MRSWLEQGLSQPISREAREAVQRGRQEHPAVWIIGGAGIRGYMAGPRVHLLDHYGLTDPLLARMPATWNPRWRVGHFERQVPRSYARSVERRASAIRDPDLREYDDRLRTITRDPIWTIARFKEIWRMNVAGNDHLVDRDAWRFARTQTVEPASDARSQPILKLERHEGITVELGRKTTSSLKLELQLAAKSRYVVLYFSGDTEVGQTTLDLSAVADTPGALVAQTVVAPEAIAREGIDKIRVLALERRAAVGPVRVR